MLPIGGYTLALIWAPEACQNRSDTIDAAFACARGNRFGFTLHGLWPDGEGAIWPQYCAAAPRLPEALIRRHLCATPSAQLLQHEYAKHGTCTGLPPETYFARSTGLYGRLHFPDMRAIAGRRDLTARQFAAAFARVNPGLTAEMIRLNVNRRGWLEEVWLCLDTRLRYRTCPITQSGAPATARIRVQAPPTGR
jgi:ribonuclease T2